MTQITLSTVLVALCAVAVFAANPDIKIIPGGKSGSGTTTRYWDCCKPSCGWEGNIKTPSMVPVTSCALDGSTPIDDNTQSGCATDGSAFMCSNQQPWVINDTLAYGFIAASFTGGADNSMCCACLLFSFKDQITNKKMVVQVTNTGSEGSVNSFDINIPGGGVGYYWQGCDAQWQAGQNGWGQRYGGVSSEAECNQLPAVLQPGCKFRFQWMEGASNPNVDFVQVQCPAELVALTGCDLPNSLT